MSFLRPEFLPLVLAAVLPAAVHLFFRHIRRREKLPTLRFFFQTNTEEKRWRNIREWVLLAIRTLAILLLALAFARPAPPSVVAAAKGKASGEAVILFDRSLSMAAHSGGGRIIEKARAEAVDAVTALPADVSVTVIAFDETAEVLLRGGTDRGEILSVIRGIDPAGKSGDLTPALSAFRNSVTNSAQPARLILISDLQKNLFDGVSPELLAGVPMELILGKGHGNDRIANTGIGSVALSGKSEPAGRFALVADNATGAARTVVLMREDGQEVFRSNVASGKVQDVPLDYAWAESETRTFTIVSTPSDALVEDDRRTFTVVAPKPVAVDLRLEKVADDYVRTVFDILSDNFPIGGDGEIFVGDPGGYFAARDGGKIYHGSLIFSDGSSGEFQRLAALLGMKGTRESGGEFELGLSGESFRDRNDRQEQQSGMRAVVSGRIRIDDAGAGEVIGYFSDEYPAMVRFRGTGDHEEVVLVGASPGPSNSSFVLSPLFPVLIRDALGFLAPQSFGRIVEQSPDISLEESLLSYLSPEEAIAKIVPDKTAAIAQPADLADEDLDPTRWWRFFVMAVLGLALVEMVIGRSGAGALV